VCTAMARTDIEAPCAIELLERTERQDPRIERA
jgi:hypothetical protein